MRTEDAKFLRDEVAGEARGILDDHQRTPLPSMRSSRAAKPGRLSIGSRPLTAASRIRPPTRTGSPWRMPRWQRAAACRCPDRRRRSWRWTSAGKRPPSFSGFSPSLSCVVTAQRSSISRYVNGRARSTPLFNGVVVAGIAERVADDLGDGCSSSACRLPPRCRQQAAALLKAVKRRADEPRRGARRSVESPPSLRAAGAVETRRPPRLLAQIFLACGRGLSQVTHVAPVPHYTAASSRKRSDVRPDIWSLARGLAPSVARHQIEAARDFVDAAEGREWWNYTSAPSGITRPRPSRAGGGGAGSRDHPTNSEQAMKSAPRKPPKRPFDRYDAIGLAILALVAAVVVAHFLLPAPPPSVP